MILLQSPTTELSRTNEPLNTNALAEKWLSTRRLSKESALTERQLRAEATMKHLLLYVFSQPDFKERDFSDDLFDGDGIDPVEQVCRRATGNDQSPVLWEPSDDVVKIVTNLKFDELSDPESNIAQIIAGLEKNISREDLTKISNAGGFI